MGGPTSSLRRWWICEARKFEDFSNFFIFLCLYFNLNAQLHYKFPVLSDISGSSVWEPVSQHQWSGFICLLMQGDRSAEGSDTTVHQEKESGEEYLPFISVLSSTLI